MKKVFLGKICIIEIPKKKTFQHEIIPKKFLWEDLVPGKSFSWDFYDYSEFIPKNTLFFVYMRSRGN
jgi:hypothetical protein